MPAPSIAAISFGIDEKAARVVQKHPRLTAMLPATVDELVTGFLGAKALAAAVKDLPVESVDLTADLDASLRAGEIPDAADLVENYAAAQRKAAEVRAVVEQLSALPVRYVSDIVRMIADEVLVMPDVLSEELNELLDRAEPVVAKLDGIDSADAALDAGLGDDWLALKDLTTEYDDLRQAHVALARLDDTANMAPGSVGLALVLFGGIEDVVPDLPRRLTGQVRNAITGEAITALPFPIFDFRDPAHLLAVVRHRAVLDPHVARPSKVGDRRDAAYEAGEPTDFQPEPGRLAQEYGGEESVLRHSRVARRVRSQGTIATPRFPQPFDLA
jgi:hypothetical protein